MKWKTCLLLHWTLVNMIKDKHLYPLLFLNPTLSSYVSLLICQTSLPFIALKSERKGLSATAVRVMMWSSSNPVSRGSPWIFTLWVAPSIWSSAASWIPIRYNHLGRYLMLMRTLRLILKNTWLPIETKGNYWKDHFSVTYFAHCLSFVFESYSMDSDPNATESVSTISPHYCNPVLIPYTPYFDLSSPQTRSRSHSRFNLIWPINLPTH